MKDAWAWPVVAAATAKYALTTAGATPQHGEEEVADAAEEEEERGKNKEPELLPLLLPFKEELQIGFRADKLEFD